MNPREMERYNPFASDQPKASVSSSDLDQSYASQRAQLLGHLHQLEAEQRSGESAGESPTRSKSNYSTSFPDPFGLDDDRFAPSSSRQTQQPPPPPPPAQSSNRSNSVTFLNRIGDDDDQTQAGSTLGRAASQRGTRQASGFTSFLSRATSVTSSSVTDRVSGAVGSVRSAVDSLSSQIQQAVPSSSGLISTGSASSQDQQHQAAQQQAGGQSDVKQSAASYLAARLSSATNQFVNSPSTPLANSLSSTSNHLDAANTQTATICRQRVVLILSDPTRGPDWAQQFNLYRRLVSGAAPQSSSLAFTSFFTSQFSSSAGSGGGQSDGGGGAGGDLIEQVHFKDVSVLANQSSATAVVYVGGSSALALSSTQSSQTLSSSTLPINRLALNLVNATVSSATGSQQQQQQHQQQQQMLFQNQAQQQQLQSQLQPDGQLAKTIRPEYVVVRQRGGENSTHLRSIVKALDYCCVPMFEPFEVWNVFQDRQLIFAKLLRVQRQLSKEQFPLIPQVFCQTHKDLLNYIQNSFISLPCLLRTGPLGKGKIRVDNLQMLKDFATIMATSEQSCTIEQYLDVKCDLIVQKLGTSLKLFKGKSPSSSANSHSMTATAATNDLDTAQQDSIGRQPASRQTSLGSGVLSSLISAGASSQLLRNNSNSSSMLANQSNFEKMSEVNARYRRWIEAIGKEFDNKLDVFCIKIVVAANDREYIVGMRNCSMEFLGNLENQDEDRRSFVELIISKMNTVLPKHQPVSREASNSSCTIGNEQTETSSLYDNEQQHSKTTRLGGSDKRAHLLSQANVGSGPRFEAMSQDQSGGASGQMLNNRNRSVSMNQGEPPMRPLNQSEWNQSPIRQLPGGVMAVGVGQTKSSAYNMTRRASDRSDSMLTNGSEFGHTDSPPSGTSARQMSIGQSIFDQTSTALSSFQRQSISFLRRLDTRTGAELSSGGTPPLSAKSDTFFERNYANSQLSNGGGSSGQQKSQSVDTSPELVSRASGLPPPKPPPPPPTALMNRQSSLAGYGQHRSGSGQQRVRSESSSSNAPITPQNSINQQSSFSDTNNTTNGAGQQHRQPQRVIRQNSALSAFEPFDPGLRGESFQGGPEQSGEREPLPGRSGESQSDHKSQSGKFDSVSMLSANSNTSDETNTAEDTMNNLKKTFASIFGDKCD